MSRIATINIPGEMSSSLDTVVISLANYILHLHLYTTTDVPTFDHTLAPTFADAKTNLPSYDDLDIRIN